MNQRAYEKIKALLKNPWVFAHGFLFIFLSIGMQHLNDQTTWQQAHLNDPAPSSNAITTLDPWQTWKIYTSLFTKSHTTHYALIQYSPPVLKLEGQAHDPRVLHQLQKALIENNLSCRLKNHQQQSLHFSFQCQANDTP